MKVTLNFVMIEMIRKFKVLQCPNCAEFIYFSLVSHPVSCYLCQFTIQLHKLEGTFVSSIQEAQIIVQENQSTNQTPVHPDPNLQIAEHVLKILRSYRLDNLKWLPLHEVFHQCFEAGLLIKETRNALEILTAEGFLEKRGDTIRVVPLN
jgi:hypothetical protein